MVYRGRSFALSAAKDLPSYIISKASEAVTLGGLVAELSAAITRRVLYKKEPIDYVVEDTHRILTAISATLPKMTIENVYRDSPARTDNIEIWRTAESLAAGRAKTTDVKRSRSNSDCDRSRSFPDCRLEAPRQIASGTVQPKIEFSTAPIDLDQVTLHFCLHEYNH
jgi:hypothetical protein